MWFVIRLKNSARKRILCCVVVNDHPFVANLKAAWSWRVISKISHFGHRLLGNQSLYWSCVPDSTWDQSEAFLCPKYSNCICREAKNERERKGKAMSDGSREGEEESFLFKDLCAHSHSIHNAHMTQRLEINILFNTVTRVIPPNDPD